MNTVIDVAIPTDVYWTINELCAACSGTTGSDPVAVRELLQKKLAEHFEQHNRLHLAASSVVEWHHKNSGAEPSISVFHRELDTLEQCLSGN